MHNYQGFLSPRTTQQNNKIPKTFPTALCLTWFLCSGESMVRAPGFLELVSLVLYSSTACLQFSFFRFRLKCQFFQQTLHFPRDCVRRPDLSSQPRTVTLHGSCIRDKWSILVTDVLGSWTWHSVNIQGYVQQAITLTVEGVVCMSYLVGASPRIMPCLTHKQTHKWFICITKWVLLSLMFSVNNETHLAEGEKKKNLI